MNAIKDDEARVVEKLDRNGRLKERIWYGLDTEIPHRVDEPARQKFDPDSGKLTGEIWINRLRHGKHRGDNLPAETSIDPVTGVVIIELYYRDGRLHRDDGGPCEIYRDAKTGIVTNLTFRDEGYLHREGEQPAVQEFNSETGNLVRVEYYEDGELHRFDGPAIIEYDDAGHQIPGTQQYYSNGEPQTHHGNLNPNLP